MDDSYKKYKGRVNFVWVYGNEAHPEEKPFQSGYETKDLGWKHTYKITRTMAERAQRAGWLKTDPDPDLTIPMILDFINHPGYSDDGIRKSYWGGSYYSTVIIDCDGKVLKVHSWAWYAPGKDWWGLPLQPIANLYSFLDNYLKNPPSCYSSAAGPDAGAPVDSGGARPDSRADQPQSSSGGCSTGGLPAAGSSLVLLLACGVLLRIRRRRG